MFGSTLPPVVCMTVHVLFTLFVFLLIVVSNTYCVVFLLCISSSYCCQFLWIVNFVLPLRYSLTFIYVTLTECWYLGCVKNVPLTNC